MTYPDNAELFLKENMGLVYFIIQKHYPHSIGDDDVVQEALIGLWKATLSYDPSKGAFSSYAVQCIHNNIRMYFRREGRHSSSISMNAIVNEENETEFGDLMEDPLAGVEESGIFVKDFISSLSEKEQQIVRLQLSQVKQVDACKYLGHSQAWYSRLLNRIRKKWERYNKEGRCFR